MSNHHYNFHHGAHRLEYMNVASQICDNILGAEIRRRFLDNFTDIDSFTGIIQTMSPSFEDTAVLCKLFNRWSNCRDMLFPIFSEEGLCFTFNFMRFSDILTTGTYVHLPFYPSLFKRQAVSLLPAFSLSLFCSRPQHGAYAKKLFFRTEFIGMEHRNGLRWSREYWPIPGPRIWYRQTWKFYSHSPHVEYKSGSFMRWRNGRL